MTEHIKKLKEAVEKAHNVKAKHEESSAIRETIKGNALKESTVWEGVVETFVITGHHMAKRCYAWSNEVGEETRYTVVLEIPPVAGPRGAVRTAMVAAARQARPPK